MKIRLLSDLHMDDAPWTAPLSDADVTVVAGDLFDDGIQSVKWCSELRKASGKPVIFVPGNHEFSGSSLPLRLREMARCSRAADVHFLYNRNVVIGGVRFVGATLWSDFSAEQPGLRELAMSAAEDLLGDFSDIQYGPSKLRASHYCRMHQRSLRAIDAALVDAYEEPVVVVSHFPPTVQGIPASLSTSALKAAFASPLEEFVRNSSAKAWFFGHLHQSSDCCLGVTRTLSNPRGHGAYLNEKFDPLLEISI